MLGKTHHAGGTAAALLAFEVMRLKGWLISDCNEFVQLLIMYPFASFGSIFSDLDHGPDSIPSKDPVAVMVNKLLRLTGAKHRSWQTHSILVTGGFCFFIFSLVYAGNKLFGGSASIEWAFLRLSVIGFIVGVASHLFLDAFTTAGIHIWPGFKMRFVPRRSFFATGGAWEKIWFWLLILIICVLIGKVFVLDFLRLFNLKLIKM